MTVTPRRLDGVTLTVEVGFDSNPLASSITWTDVSADVREASMSRGRTADFEQFATGRLRLVLDNRTRKYDPTHTSSDYYGKLLPNKAVRIRATYSAVTYDIWYGYVDEWLQDYDQSNHDAICTVVASDGFKLLANSRLPESVWAKEIAALTPSAWWRLGEREGTIMKDASGNGHEGVYEGGATFNSRTGLTYGSTDNAIYFPRQDSATLGLAQWAPGSFPITLVIALDLSAAALAQFAVFAPDGGQTSPSWSLYAQRDDEGSSGGHGLQITEQGPTGSTANRTSTTPPTTRPFLALAVVHLDGATYPELYVNGSAVGSTAGTQQTGIPVPPVLLVGFDATADEVVILDGDQSASAATIYGYWATPWTGDDTGARVGRILDAVAWPAGLRDLGTGVTTLGPTDLGARFALDYLRSVEITEQGQLFMGVDGKVVFRNRHWRITNTSGTVSQGVFSDGAAETYANLPGTSGSYVSTPHAGYLSPSDLDFQIRVAMTDWTPTATQTLIGKGNGTLQWRVDVNPAGTITLGIRIAGVTYTPTSSAAPTVSNGQTIWLRVTRISSTGAVNFYTAPDQAGIPASTAWTQLGTADVATGHTGDAGITSSDVYLGSLDGTTQMLAGKVWEFGFWGGPTGGIELLHFYAWEMSTTVPFTGVSSSLSNETWTSAGTASIVPGVPTNPYLRLRIDANSIVWLRSRLTGRRATSTTGQEARDATAITNYGEITEDVGTTLHQTDQEVSDLLNWRLAQRNTPALRLTELEVQPRRKPSTLYPQVLDRDIGDRITVIRTPQRRGSPISQDCHIEGIEHRVTKTSWATTYLLSPADTRHFLILDDLTYGQLDEEVLAY